MLKTCSECSIPLSRREAAEGQCPICGAHVPQFSPPEVRPTLSAVPGSRDDPFDELWFRRHAATAAEAVVPPPHNAHSPVNHPSRRNTVQRAARDKQQPWRIGSSDESIAPVTEPRTPERKSAVPSDAIPSDRYVMTIELEGADESHEIELSSRELNDIPRLADRLLPGRFTVSLQPAGGGETQTVLQFEIGVSSAAQTYELYVRDSLGQLRQLSEQARQDYWKRWYEQLAARAGIRPGVSESGTWVMPATAEPGNPEEQAQPAVNAQPDHRSRPDAGAQPVVSPASADGAPPAEPVHPPHSYALPGTSEVITDLWAEAGMADEILRRSSTRAQPSAERPEGERLRMDSGMAELGRRQLRAGRSAQTQLKLRRIRTSLAGNGQDFRD